MVCVVRSVLVGWNSVTGVSSVLTGSAGTAAARVRTGRGSAGTVSPGTVSAGPPESGCVSVTGSRVLIPEVTDAIRPSATPATNTMTTPSAVKKPSCSMIRMYTVVLAGEPPMGTWLFHSGLSTGPSVNQAPAA